MKGSDSSNDNTIEGDATSTDWEMRPGGMLVQKREGEEDGGWVAGGGPTIRVKVCRDTSEHELCVPAQSTFGELKRVLTQFTGLEPQEQRLLFRGKEKDNEEFLHMAGVKDTSKIVLLEDPASKERRLEMDLRISKACEAVVIVRSEVDKLAEKATALEAAVNGGTKVAEKEFLVLTELLMVQLLKLDGIEAEEEAKVQRRIEVRRIQSLVDTIDALKAKNSNPFRGGGNAVTVTTQWETFESGVGSLSAPPPMQSSAKPTDAWEQFD